MSEIEVLVNGSTFTSKIETFKVERNLNDKSYCEVSFVNDPPIDISIGDTLVIKAQSHSETLTKIFSGEVVSVSRSFKEGEPILEVRSEDLLNHLEAQNIYKYYSSETGKSILLDILSLYPEITTNNVEDCSTTIDFTAKGKTRLEAIQDLSSRVNYDFYLDPENDFHFFERDSKVSGMTIAFDDLEKYSYKRDASQIVNRVLVLGAKFTIPEDGDAWTESTANWTGSPDGPYLVGHVAPFMPRAGKNAITVRGTSESGTISLSRSFTTIDFSQVWSPSHLDFDLGMKAESGISSIYLRLKTDASNYFQKDLTAKYPTSGGGWIHISEEIGSGWTEVGSPSWDSISSLEIVVHFDTPSEENQVFVDRLYFSGARYHGYAEDTTSQETWGLHEPPYIVRENIHSDSECQDLAEAIISNNKDPKEIIEEVELIQGWEDLPLGEKVEFQIPEGTFTSRVVKIIHDYNSKGFITQLTLSDTARTLEDILSTHDQELKQISAEKREEEKRLPPPSGPSLPTDIEDIPDVIPEVPTFSVIVKEIDTETDFRTWLEITIDLVENAGGYIVGYRKPGEGEKYIQVSQPSSGTQVTISTPYLEENTTYQVRVCSVSKLGTTSDWSSFVSVTTASNDTPPPVPTGLVASPLLNGVLLDWDSVQATDFSHYRVYYGTTSPPTNLAGEVSRPFFLWKLKESEAYTSYYFAVSSVDSSGNESDLSTPVSTTPLQVESLDIAPDAITAEKILDGAVTDIKLASGAVTLAKFASGIRPVQIVDSLPPLPDPDYPQGAVVFLTTENKLYRSTGTEWTAAVPTLDLVGQITETQISDEAITTPKLAANAVVADKIAANAVTSDKIAANAVIAGKIAAGAVSTDELAANAVTADKIQAGAVDASKLTVAQIFIDGLTFTDHSPDSQSVTWSSCTVYYQGNKYTISGNSTNKKYIYWNVGDTTFSTSDTKPSWAENRFMIAINRGGVHTTVWNATLIHGGTIIAGTITAQELTTEDAVITNSVQIGDGIIYSDHINGTLGIDASKIVISAENGVYLINWAHPDDVTRIDGGQIYTGSITSEQITADWITGKKFRTSDSFPRIEFDSNQIAGFASDGTKQFYIQSSDGKAYAGGVVLDASGITAGGGHVVIDGNGITVYGEKLMFKDLQTLELSGQVYGSGPALILKSGTNGNIVLRPSLDVVVEGNLEPSGTWNLGSSTSKWNEVHAVDLYGTAHYADVYFKDLECPICDERFKVGDKLVFTIVEVSDKEIRCLPAHLRCVS